MIFYYVINDNVVDQFGHKYLYLEFDGFQSRTWSVRELEQNSDFVFSVNSRGQHKWIKNRMTCDLNSQFDDEFLMLAKLSSIEYT